MSTFVPCPMPASCTTKPDPLNEAVESIPTAKPKVRLPVADGLYTGEHFINTLRVRRLRAIDVCCYSVGEEAGKLKLPIRQVLYSTGPKPSVGTQHRWLPFVHAKIWRVYDSQGYCTIYIGSMNLGCPSLAELVIRLSDPRQYRAVNVYYDRLWSIAKPT